MTDDQETTATAEAEYMRVLGDELRAQRKSLSWIRKRLRAELGDDVSVQTLATYELGTRKIAVPQLDRICRKLGTQASVLLGRVEERLYARDGLYPAASFKIDLGRLAELRNVGIDPACNWARAQQRYLGSTTIAVGIGALETLALLCGTDDASLDVVGLYAKLRSYGVFH